MLAGVNQQGFEATVLVESSHQRRNLHEVGTSPAHANDFYGFSHEKNLGWPQKGTKSHKKKGIMRLCHELPTSRQSLGNAA
jgi:hypothetical protein